MTAIECCHLWRGKRQTKLARRREIFKWWSNLFRAKSAKVEEPSQPLRRLRAAVPDPRWCQQFAVRYRLAIWHVSIRQFREPRHQQQQRRDNCEREKEREYRNCYVVKASHYLESFAGRRASQDNQVHLATSQDHRVVARKHWLSALDRTM